MNTYLISLKKWYENRNIREKIFVLALGWAISYAFFSLFLFNPLNAQEAGIVNDIKVLNNKISTWNMQIEDLNKISSSPLYKQWENQRNSFQNLKGQYQNLMDSSTSSQWRRVIQAILYPHENITIVQIRNSPETLYNSAATTKLKTEIYEKKLMMTVFSNYFDTLAYLQWLEKLLPNVHWNSLSYQVAQYPIAKIDLEFSIFYDKTN